MIYKIGDIVHFTRKGSRTITQGQVKEDFDPEYKRYTIAIGGLDEVHIQCTVTPQEIEEATRLSGISKHAECLKNI